MAEDIETRILAEFKRGLEREPDLSPGTKEVLREWADGTGIRDDEALLEAVAGSA